MTSLFDGPIPISPGSGTAKALAKLGRTPPDMAVRADDAPAPAPLALPAPSAAPSPLPAARTKPQAAVNQGMVAKLQRVYEAFDEYGPCSIPNVAKRLELKRGTAYKQVQTLVAVGLLETMGKKTQTADPWNAALFREGRDL